LKIPEISKQLRQYKEEGKRIFTSSSFQSHSLVMLHILSRIDNSIPVFFLNTGYHFPETINFKNQISELFGLNVIDLVSDTPKYMQKDQNGKLLFASDPDYCCYLNKVQPIENVMLTYDVWVNGVRADQSSVRKSFRNEQSASHGVIRFHPMLDWTMKDIYRYKKEYNLPSHPLEEMGYLSIGCEPCTRKFDSELQEREARWFGMRKVECGLHTDLVRK